MQNLTTVRKVTSLNEQHIRLANNKTNMGVKIGKMGKKSKRKSTGEDMKAGGRDEKK